MSNTAEVQFVGSAQQLMAEYDKLKAKNEQLVRDLKASGQASKQANAEHTRMARDAKAAVEATLTPLERYRKRMEEVKAALRDGAISQQQFNAMNRQAHEEMTRAAKAADDLGRAGKKVYDETRTPLEKYKTAVHQLLELYGKGKIDQDTFNRGLAKQKELMQASHPTLAATATELGKAALGFAGIGSATAAIAVAAQAIKVEYEALLERQRQALGEQEPFGQSFRKTLTAFTPDATVGSPVALEGEIQRIAAATGTNPSMVARVTESALSSQGPLSNKDTLSAVEESLRLLPGDEASALQMSGTIQALGKQTGVTDSKVLAGFVTQAKAATNIRSDTGFGQSFVPGVLSAMTRGDSPEQAAEVFATMNNLMEDWEGMRSRTATIQLSEQLATAFPKLPSTSARIAHLQKNPQLAEGFLADANFESSAQAFVEKLLRGDAGAMAIQSDMQQRITPLSPDNATAWEKRIAELNAAPKQGVNAVGAGIGTAVDLFQLGSDRDAQIEQLRKQLFTGDNAVASQINFPSVADDFSILGFPIGDRAQARQRFETRAGRGDDPREIGLATVADIEGYFAPVPGRDSRPMSESQVQLLAEIKGVLERMERKPATGTMPSAGLSRNN